MIVKRVRWKDIGLNEADETCIIALVDHRLAYNQDSGLNLDPEFFEINVPFYMESEKWWKSQGDDQKTMKKRKAISRTSYLDSLSCRDKLMIDWSERELHKNMIKFDDKEKMDNSQAKKKAKTVQLKSSGINLLNGDLIYSNNCEKAILVQIAFQDYVIPRESCFVSNEVKIGLQLLQDKLMSADWKKIDFEEKFLVIIDPPWENKSVKRKKSYDRQDSDDILQMGQLLAQLLEKIQQSSSKHIDIRVAIWTTEKFKRFTIEELLPRMNMKLDCCLLWHKITKSWESVKVRGSQEYLIVASLVGQENPFEGLLISIPSAIHSHKPPISFDLAWLIDEDSKESSSTENDLIISPPLNGSLNIDRCPKLRGLELYARYLREGFFSIGYECIKLQSKEIFV